MDGSGRGQPWTELPPTRVHLVGIGAKGMTGLAHLLVRRGVTVSGSAAATAPGIAGLRRLGVRVSAGHAPGGLPRGAGLLVYSPEVPREDPQRLRAARLGMPQVSAAQVLDGLMRRRLGVAVVGTRGASQAAAMIGWTLILAGHDPTTVLGADAPQLGGWARWGRGPHGVVEAIEAPGRLAPEGTHVGVAAILGPPPGPGADRTAAVSLLRRFAHGIPRAGYIVGRARSASVRRALRGAGATTEWLSLGRDVLTSWRGADLREDRGRYRFRAFHRGRFVVEVKLQVPGRRGVLGALSAVAVGVRLGVPVPAIKEGLEEFAGLTRRLQCRGRFRGVTLVDDAAQDPGAVAEALTCCRQVYGRRRLRAVVRTDWVPPAPGGWDAFAVALAEADDVLLVAGTSARIGPPAAPAHPLVRALHARGVRASLVAGLDDAIDVLDRHLEPGDVLVTLGADDVGKVADAFLRRLPRDHHGL
jgi:UDP-N-acetylmuramate--alanine ligase